LRPLGRHITVLVVPHTSLPLLRGRFSLAFLLSSAALWTCLTVWAGWTAARQLDYWITKADNRVLRAKLAYMASRIEESRADLDRARETDRQLRSLLGMRSRRAIIETEEGMGGPQAADRLGLLRRLTLDPLGMNPAEIRSHLSRLRQESQRRLASFQEISWYINHKRSVFRFTPLGWPAEGRVTSLFGYRFSPVTRTEEADANEFHSGVDIANNADTPILATADGTVRHAGWSGGYGRMVLLDHEWGYSTLYGHTSKVLVRPGAGVRRGQIVAYMGTTGRSTGNHLHYEIWHHGKPVNPMRFASPQRGAP